MEINDFLLLDKLHPEGYPLPQEFLGRFDIVIELISRGMPATHACAAAGVRRKDYDYCLRHHEELSNKILAARAIAVEDYKDQIAAAGRDSIKSRTIVDAKGGVTTVKDEVKGDWKATAWLLERFDRDGFGPVAGSVTVNVDVSSMIQDTVRSIAAKASKLIEERAQDAEFREVNAETQQEEQEEG